MHVKIVGSELQVRLNLNNSGKIGGAKNNVVLSGVENQIDLDGVDNRVSIPTGRNRLKLDGDHNNLQLLGPQNEVKISGDHNGLITTGSDNKVKLSGRLIDLHISASKSVTNASGENISGKIIASGVSTQLRSLQRLWWLEEEIVTLSPRLSLSVKSKNVDLRLNTDEVLLSIGQHRRCDRTVDIRDTSDQKTYRLQFVFIGILPGKVGICRMGPKIFLNWVQPNRPDSFCVHLEKKAVDMNTLISKVIDDSVVVEIQKISLPE